MIRGRVERTGVERRCKDDEALKALIPRLKFSQCYARQLMGLSLILSDLASLALAIGIALWARSLVGGESGTRLLLNLVLLLPLGVLVYAFSGLYPGVGLSPVHEMERLFTATSILFLLGISASSWSQGVGHPTQLLLAAAWLLALGLVQFNRWLARIIGRHLGLWGEPVAVVGNGPEGQHIITFLKERSRLGMRPVLAVDGHADYQKSALAVINSSKIQTVVLVESEISAEQLNRFVNDQRMGYHRRKGERPIQRLILVSSLGWAGSLGVQPVDLDGMLGLEMRQNLLNKWPNILKRTMDLLLTMVFGLLFVPIGLVLAALIRLESPGKAFYLQERVGRDGKCFRMLKFRTMYENAETKLQILLQSDPDLCKEWERTQKLKRDPRVTRVGKFLRKFSLDEVPQLINVLHGEMSLVGPRPYFPDQKEIYGKGVKLYQRVRPGMTGMWQVHGRNTTSFAERVRLDDYYVRNWSVWLDIYLLLRTAQVVISRQGAY